MNMFKILEHINKATEEEFERINTEELKFHSPHEAWAILLEEVEEAEEELKAVKDYIVRLKFEIFTDLEDKKLAKEFLANTAHFAKLCAAESVQVSAVAKKFFEMVEGNENV